jgi:hypothetical protein
MHYTRTLFVVYEMYDFDQIPGVWNEHVRSQWLTSSGGEEKKNSTLQ